MPEGKSVFAEALVKRVGLTTLKSLSAEAEKEGSELSTQALAEFSSKDEDTQRFFSDWRILRKNRFPSSKDR